MFQFNTWSGTATFSTFPAHRQLTVFPGSTIYSYLEFIYMNLCACLTYPMMHAPFASHLWSFPESGDDLTPWHLETHACHQGASLPSILSQQSSLFSAFRKASGKYLRHTCTIAAAWVSKLRACESTKSSQITESDPVLIVWQKIMVFGRILSHTMMNHDEPLNPLTSCKWIHLGKTNPTPPAVGVLSGHQGSRNQSYCQDTRRFVYIGTCPTKLPLIKCIWMKTNAWNRKQMSQSHFWDQTLQTKITHFRYSNRFSTFVGGCCETTWSAPLESLWLFSIAYTCDLLRFWVRFNYEFCILRHFFINPSSSEKHQSDPVQKQASSVDAGWAQKLCHQVLAFRASKSVSRKKKQAHTLTWLEQYPLQNLHVWMYICAYNSCDYYI